MVTDYKHLAYEAINNSGLSSIDIENLYVYVSGLPSIVCRNMLYETDYKNVIAKIESMKEAAGV